MKVTIAINALIERLKAVSGLISGQPEIQLRWTYKGTPDHVQIVLRCPTPDSAQNIYSVLASPLPVKEKTPEKKS